MSVSDERGSHVPSEKSGQSHSYNETNLGKCNVTTLIRDEGTCIKKSVVICIME